MVNWIWPSNELRQLLFVKPVLLIHCKTTCCMYFMCKACIHDFDKWWDFQIICFCFKDIINKFLQHKEIEHVITLTYASIPSTTMREIIYWAPPLVKNKNKTKTLGDPVCNVMYQYILCRFFYSGWIMHTSILNNIWRGKKYLLPFFVILQTISICHHDYV